MTMKINQVHQDVSSEHDLSYGLNPSILREYDIRGIVGEQFGPQDALMIGRGYGTEIKRAGGSSVVVGYDGRLTSPALEASLVEGLKSVGLRVLRVGLGPSPMTYFGRIFLKAEAAVKVTGSHNPASHNGFKLTLFQKPFFGEKIQKLKERIDRKDFETGIGTVETHTIQDAYQAYLLKDFSENYPKARPLKVVWDPGHGATAQILSHLVKHLPGAHVVLNDYIDGTFPSHHPDPVVAENLEQLIDAVREHQADVGFAFDGDGDRLGVVDSQGNIIWGDQLLILLAQDVLQKMPGSIIIGDIKASQILFDEIQKMGGSPLMWRTGHSLIKEKMMETGSPLAGEMSGHIFFADRHFGFDDALYAALRTLGLIATWNTPDYETLSQWRSRLPSVWNTPEIRLACGAHNKFKIIADLQQDLKAQGVSFVDLDGVRMTCPDGWWLLRASNTTEEFVIRVEASTQEKLVFLQDQLNRYLKKHGLSVDF